MAVINQRMTPFQFRKMMARKRAKALRKTLESETQAGAQLATANPQSGPAKQAQPEPLALPAASKAAADFPAKAGREGSEEGRRRRSRRGRKRARKSSAQPAPPVQKIQRLVQRLEQWTRPDIAEVQKCASFLVGAGGVLSPVDAFGGQSGEMVQYEAVLGLLSQLVDPAAHRLTFRQQAYDVYVALASFVDFEMTMTMPVSIDEVPSHNMLVLVLQGEAHYSLVIVDVYDKVVHVFDTAFESSTGFVARLVDAMIPDVPLLSPEHGFQLCNHTGKLQQRGATCGPWAVWIAFAYAFNHAGCRTNLRPALDYRGMQVDPLDFWKEVVF